MADNITIEKCEIGDFVIINVTIRLRAVILSILSIAIGSKQSVILMPTISIKWICLQLNILLYIIRVINIY